MVANMLRGLEARFPWLAAWSGGRLDIELPAFLMSLTFHGLLLMGLAFAGYQAHRDVASSRIPVGGRGQPGAVGFAVSRSGSIGGADGGSADGRFVRPDALADDHLGTEHGGRRAGFGRTGGRDPSTRPGAGEAGCAPGDRGRPAHREHAGPERFHQGQWRRDGRRRGGGRRPDRRRDRPPPGARPDAGRLGLRCIGQPPGRAAAAEQAHRDRLHPHQAAR